MALSPEAQAIVLSRQEGLSPEAAKIVVARLQSPSLSMGEVATGFVKNLPGDIWNVAKGVFQAATHPRQVMEGLSDVGAGGIAKLLPEGAFKSTPEAQETRARTEQAAGQFGEHYRERYGGIENIKRSFAEHPAETMLDVSTVISPVAGRIPSLKLGGKSMTPEGRRLLQTSREKGLPLSPDVIVDSPLTNWTRKLLDIPGTPGNLAANRQRGKLAKMVMDARNEFIEDTLKMPKASRETAAALKETETAAYEAVATAAGGKETRYAVPNLKEFLDSEIKLTGSSELKDTLMKARKELAENGNLEFGMIQDLMAKKYRNFGKLGDEQKIVREELKRALEKDLATINEATDSAVKIAQDKAKQATINKASANASIYIEGLLNRATKYNEITGETMFHPALFKREFERAIPTLKKKLPFGKTGEEKINLMRQFADEMEKLSVDLSRKSKGKEMNLFEKLAVGGGIGTFATYNPLTAAGIAVPAGFQAIMANSMMKPNGIIKRWLTEGITFSPSKAIKKGAATNVLKVGGQAAIREESE